MPYYIELTDQKGDHHHACDVYGELGYMKFVEVHAIELQLYFIAINTVLIGRSSVAKPWRHTDGIIIEKGVIQ